MDKKNRKIPRLPGAEVYLDKGELGQIPVAILSSSRLPAIGFDVTGRPPHHWRPLEFGPFGVLVAFDKPVEVKVMLDGRVLAEQKMYPSKPPVGGGAPRNLQDMMAAQVTPHYLFNDEQGKPFVFLPRELADLKQGCEITRPALEPLAKKVQAGKQAQALLDKANALVEEARVLASGSESQKAQDKVDEGFRAAFAAMEQLWQAGLEELSGYAKEDPNGICLEDLDRATNAVHQAIQKLNDETAEYAETIEQAMFHVESAERAHADSGVAFNFGKSREGMEKIRNGLASLRYARQLLNLEPLAIGEYDAKKTVLEQIHPGLFSPMPSMHERDQSGPMSTEARWDVDPTALGLPPLPATTGSTNDAPSAEELEAIEKDAELAELLPADVLATLASVNAEAMESKDAQAAGEAAAPEATSSRPEQPHPLAQSLNLNERRLTWAPSHGLVAVGVRVLQQVDSFEPPMPPDTYSYTMFQLNPWELYGHAHARLWRRKVVPSEHELRNMMIEEGFGQDAPEVAAAICGCGHDHLTRRTERSTS